MPLTNCIECDHQLSDQAVACIECKTKYPFGVECELCGERLRQSVAVTSKRLVELKTYEYIQNEWIARDIFAHRNCLERYYTPPATLGYSDCRLQLSTKELGLTPLTLWSASIDYSHRFTCPRCGRPERLTSIACGESLPWKLSPCGRPLYPFQIGPHGSGHGHTEHKGEAAERRAVAEQQQVWKQTDKEKKRAEREEIRKRNTNHGTLTGLMIGGGFGIVVGFFRSCNPGQLSVDEGQWFGTTIICGVIGAIIGLVIGSAIEPKLD